MTIDFTNPTLAKLLDLLARDGWLDMEWDDMEALADRAGCDFHTGVSKCVFTCTEWDFVIKVPRYDEGASCDYCQREVSAYQNIISKYPACAPLFCAVEFIGTYGEINVYAQEKISATLEQYDYENPDEYDRLYTMAVGEMNINKEFSDLANNLRSSSRLNIRFSYLIAQTLGLAVLRFLFNWAQATNENDLHNNNVGFDSSHNPRIFDFSGWYD